MKHLSSWHRAVPFAFAVWLGCSVPVAGPTENGDKVVRGEVASVAEHPWAVMLHWLTREDSPSATTCGGTLVSPRLVLTAAHCLVGRDSDDLRIVAGEQFSVGLEDWDVRLLEVEGWEIHAEYLRNGEASDPVHDLAIVQLKEDAPPGAEPARLSEVTSLPPERAATVLGWGRTETGAPSTTLRAKRVELLEASDAPISERLRERWRNLWVTDGGDGGLCQGDSGGTLESLDERGVLLGISSRTANVGADGGRLMPCHVGAVVPSWRAAEWLRSLDLLLP